MTSEEIVAQEQLNLNSNFRDPVAHSCELLEGAVVMGGALSLVVYRVDDAYDRLACYRSDGSYVFSALITED